MGTKVEFEASLGATMEGKGWTFSTIYAEAIENWLVVGEDLSNPLLS
jgi:hypothetical protein